MKPVKLIRGETVTCRCGNHIGAIVELENVDLLEIGGGLTREVHGVCKNCGREFHWSTNNRVIEHLVQQLRPGRPFVPPVVKG